jgi:hypothetical protein
MHVVSKQRNATVYHGFQVITTPQLTKAITVTASEWDPGQLTHCQLCCLCYGAYTYLWVVTMVSLSVKIAGTLWVIVFR